MAPRKPAKVKIPKWTLKKSVGGVVSTAIEEDVPVNYWIVGSREWVDSWFEPDALAAASKIVYVSSSGDLSAIKDELAKVPNHGLDSETGQDIWTRPDATEYEKKFGMEPWMPTSQMLMAQYGTREFQLILEPRLVPEFRCFLESEKWKKLLQNACFDFKFFLGKLGVHLVNLYDTMLTEQQLTAGLNGLKVGLMELARRYKPYRIIRKDVRDLFVTFKIGVDRFTKDMCVYGARDVVLLFDIHDGQIPKIKQWKLDPINDLENLTVMCTAEMEYIGVPMAGEVLTLGMTYFDERDEYLQKGIISLVGDTLAEKEDYIFGLFGKESFEFNVSSAPARLQMFREELGFDINDVQRETMAGISHQAGVLIAEWTGVDKYRGTYGDAMVQRISPIDGRYHPRFSQLGMGDMAGANKDGNANTGRYSSNFQQLPQPVYRFAKVNDLGECGMVETMFAEAIHLARQERGIPSYLTQ
jgi:hypothetical protein